MSKIVRRTLDFIELFAHERRPLGLTEISRLLNLPMSSCFDVVQGLQQRGYLYELAPRAGFYPTMALHDLAAALAAQDPVARHAAPRLEALRDELDESISLAKSIGDQVRYLHVWEPGHALRFSVRVGDTARRLHATSVGKGLLASLPEAEAEALIAGLELDALTPHSITDRDRLRAEVTAARAAGFAVNREESVLTALTLTGWFRWSRDTFLVTIAGPTFRVEPRFALIRDRLLATCAALAEG